MKIVALIPARAGSKRVPGKNTKLLGGKPLIQWTIDAAKASGVFSKIYVCTDNIETANIVLSNGVDVITRRHSSDHEPDIIWVRQALHLIATDAFAILRPTSPFRTADTIRRAWDQFKLDESDSLRAVEPWDGPHPGKMWTYCNVTCRLYSVMDQWTEHAPYHSSPTQSLVPVFRQNASLEMVWGRTVQKFQTITGNEIEPFFTEGWEGFDINTPDDWDRAEAHAKTLLAAL
jgi:CMP-N,N'-diacetyllegionaminic acid synthase